MQRLFFLLLVFTVMVMPGCGVVEGIFKAGMWWAFFLVFLAVVGVIWLVSKFRK